MYKKKEKLKQTNASVHQVWSKSKIHECSADKQTIVT